MWGVGAWSLFLVFCFSLVRQMPAEKRSFPRIALDRGNRRSIYRITLGIAGTSSMLILHESPREVVWHEDSRYNERIFGEVGTEGRLR